MSIAITATAKKIGMPVNSCYTLYNSGSTNTVWIHTDIAKTGFAGTDAELADLAEIELQPGESVTIEKQLNDVLAVCGTGKSSTLRKSAGKLRLLKYRTL